MEKKAVFAALIAFVFIFAALWWISESVQSRADINLNDVVRVRGVLLFDSSYSVAGNHVMRIRLEEVTNSFGNSASSSGVLTVVGHENILVSCGTEIVAYGKMSDSIFIYKSFTVAGKGRLSVFREKLIKWFEKRILGEFGTAADYLGMALLLGRTETYELEIREKAKECGCLHILALSGMHLNIISSFCFFVFGKRKTGKIVSFAAVTFFVFTAGPRPSLVRAYIMMILSFMPIGERLVISFFIHLLIFPFHASDMGFTYGYLALAGIIFIGPLIKGMLKNYMPEKIAELLSSSISAIILTVPMQLRSEGVWHPCTFIISPVASLLAEISMAGTMLKMIWPTFQTDFVYRALYRIFDIFEAFPEGGWALYCTVLLFFVILGCGIRAYSHSSHFRSRLV